jgi:hypothetical protein
MKKEENVKRGKKAYKAGKDWEKKTREHLEQDKLLVVSRWMNNVDLEADRMVPAKAGKFLKNRMGFPDFFAFDRSTRFLIGIESKLNGKLKQEEKLKCRWFLEHHIFDGIYISQKDPDTGKVKLVKFE